MVVTLNLTEHASEALRDLSLRSGRSESYLARFGLSLAKLYFDEQADGNLILVADKKGRPLLRVKAPDAEPERQSIA